MDNESETQVNSSASGRRDPGWKYGRLVNEKDLNTIICIFCDKVTKGGIYRHKQHLVGGYRNAKKCRKCPEHVREEMEEYMSSKKNQKEQMNMESEYVNEDLFGLEDENIGEEINSRTNVTNISSGGSNRGGSGGRTFSSKKPRQKGHIDHFFTPNAEMVVQNRRSGKMNQTTINDAYKKEARERACMLITRCMYEAAIPFNAVTYPNFQPMIEAIGQYGVGMKGPTFHEVRVTNLKKELALTKDLMKDHMVEWGKNGCSIMLDGWTDRKERTLVNFLVNCSKGTMFMQSIDASSMIKTGEKMFELLDKWVEQVGEENVIQVITDNHSSYIHSKRRNRLDHQRLNDLVYIKYNRALKRRYNARNTIDPISLKDINDSNEWLIGRMEDEDSHGGAQDDFVFDDDNLTWGDVARAAGVEEARFDTRARARASSSIIPPTRGIASSSRTLPSHSLIDEDEDGGMVDSADEEDGKGYKCGDGNDDNDDFVDLEE
ncbi:hypothetical protein CK203_101561 [Vitis vinifera]|uniref:DUF659 domain-containing protein n=1 Tax=Vitis vinifera TaxID=29760 RepID=A0A438DMT3_VITVI|nr:hypothetical protein CK203_101561 [Vitis vinifera]